MATTPFPNLFSPLAMRNVVIRNRIVSTGHATVLAEDGMPGPTLNAYQAEKARGGAGLIICYGSAAVHDSSPAFDWGGVELYNDKVIPYLINASAAVHKHGAKIFAQISHRGRRGASDLSWTPLLAPSGLPERVHRETPHEMDIDQINDVVRAYGKAAGRLKSGGFDGVEIMIGSGHLPEQFLSPFSNQRTDAYGGSLENRVRFSKEVMESVRENVGEDFVVGLRVGGEDERTKGGLSRADQLDIIEMLETTGQADYLSVVGATPEYMMGQSEAVPAMWFKTGLWVDWSAEVKRHSSLAILIAGRITDPMQGEWIVSEAKADLVAMTRAMIADPHLANKAREGRVEDIRPCIGSNQGCIGRLFHGKPITCIHNPVVSREAELAVVKPAKSKKKVVVVGGGPAGLEAARVAAERGHNVVLFEKKPVLGGQITPYTKAAGREDFGAITIWLEEQARKLGVDIRLGTEATADYILAESPDAVIIATGSVALPPDIPGAESGPVVTTEEALTKEVDWGNKVLVIDQDGHHKGPAVAEQLALQGRNVEVVSDLFTVGEDIDISVKPLVYQRLYTNHVTLSPNTEVKEIREEQVVLRNIYNNEERTVDGVTTIVHAGLRRAQDDLYKTLKGKVDDVRLVGDAMAPRRIHDAILEGTRAGRAV